MRFVGDRSALGVLGAGALGAGLFLVALSLRSNSYEAGPFRPTLIEAILRWLDVSTTRVSRLEASTTRQNASVLCLAFASMVAAYVYALRSSWLASCQSWRPIAAVAAACMIPLLLSPHLLSSDSYLYLMHGRIVTVHGGNPYIDPPAIFADRYGDAVFWRGSTAAYGPVWIYLSALVAFIADLFAYSDAVAALIFRMVGAVAHLGSGWLIWRIVERRAPQNAPLAAAIFLLNPVVLVESAASGHNDAVMVLMILLACDRITREKWLPAVLWLTAAALVKITVAPLLAIAALARIRMGSTHGSVWRDLLTGGLGCALLAVAAYLPFWAGLPTLFSLGSDPSQRRALHSLVELAVSISSPGVYPDLPFFFPRDAGAIATHTRVARIALAVTALGGIVGLWCAWRDGVHGMLRGFLWFWMSFCVVGAVWFWPWYTILAVALAAVSDSRLRVYAVGLSVAALFIYVAHAWRADPGVLYTDLYRLQPILTFGLPLLPVMWLAWRGRRPRAPVGRWSR